MSIYTTEKFITKCKEIHGEKYDYSLTNYTNAKNKIKIICFKHGIFEQRSAAHKDGAGCPKCAGKYPMDTSYFIEKSKEVHSDVYDYTKVKYTSPRGKVIIGCPTHGWFKQEAKHHVRKIGCPKCGNIKAGKKQSVNCASSFISRSKIIHGDNYDYSLTVYKKANEKVKIICPSHSDFLQSPDKHVNGKKGCPSCAMEKINVVSKPETAWLDSIDIPMHMRQKRIYLNDNRYVIADGYDSLSKTLYEYYGDYWHGNPTVYGVNNPLYIKTIDREKRIKNSGYNIIVEWETPF